MSNRRQVSIEGRTLELSNLDKPMFPRTGFSKGDLIDYYRQVSPWLLPHLRNRPLTLKRYPDGVEGGHFYEKSCPSHRPEWLETAAVWSEGRGEDIHFCLLNDLPSLVWAANLADLELHTVLAKAEDIERPTLLAFDLDPGPPATLRECCEVALMLRELFEHLGLKSFPKTSGRSGMQVYVPLNTAVSYEETKVLARAVAELLEREHPDLVVSNMRKSLRKERVLIDWSQNDRHKTTVCVYSLRASREPSVSTPLTWDEVQLGAESGADSLSFGPGEVLSRLRKQGDLFAEVLNLEQDLPRLGEEGVPDGKVH